MLSLEERLTLVVEDVWQALPPLKRAAPSWDIRLDPTLGATHGEFAPDEGIIRIHPKLLAGDTPQALPLIDRNGDDPARTAPWVSRIWHTVCHECFHAIGYATGLDADPAYLALGGWVQAEDDPPQTGRYWERRPGWEQGPSAWRYRRDGRQFFVREYATKSPYEQFADACTHIALGWEAHFGRDGQRELAWLRRHVWEEVGPRAVQAATHRWRQQLRRVLEAAADPQAQQKRWRRDAQVALGVGLTALLRSWRAQWRALVAQQTPWPSAGVMAQQVQAVLESPLTTLYERLWTQATGEGVPSDVLEQQIQAQARAAASFGQTTLDRLTTQVTPVLGQEARVIAQALETVQTEALQVRTPLLTRTETARVAQAAARDAARLEGAEYGIWRTTSGNPCEWCLSLEGQRFAIEGALFELGDTVTSRRGKTMVIAYNDVFHPPIHANCQCTIDYD